ncbi:DUF6449 domain-containing protein [Niallia sp. NCCP-28]|uniref:DUF6449 domain-containing protein n=1 Tax=Niallia sp. NCCP-28 TaxID=2934712 RepID=UPI0020821046|nr:DUF6449 domain-containing protein [Niallia sp. NCCP-28]GKU84778.1 hypothetical protein NCCP28_41740 [Niallia sp. NCCP-28]
MPSKTSFYHKQLAVLILRNVGWVSMLSFFALFFSVPLYLLLIEKDEAWKNSPDYYPMFEKVFDVNVFIQIIVMILLPLLLAIFLFRFLQSKSYSDLIHSMPIKRNYLFHYYSISGIILLILPILVNGIILRLIYSVANLEYFFPVSDIYKWFLIFSIFSILLFTACVCIGMLTGLSVFQGVLTCLILVLPVGFFALLCFNIQMWVHGFPINHYLDEDKLFFLSPLLVPVIIWNDDTKVYHYLAYFLLAIVFYFLGLFLYKKRKVEYISQAIVFPQLKGLFKYVFALSFVLIGSLYGEIVDAGKPAMVIGNFFGGLVGYLLAEMILEKTWRVFYRLKQFGYFAAVVILVIGISIPFVKMYEKKVPDADAVASVSFTDDQYTFMTSDRDETNNIIKMMSSKENIQDVVALHKKLIMEKDTKDSDKNTSVRLQYKLKNGKNIYRDYAFNSNKHKDFIKPIYETEEFKTLNYSIFSWRSDDISNIMIGEGIRLLQKDEIIELMTVLKRDILKESYEDMKRDYWNNVNIEFTLKDKNNRYYNMTINPTYTETINWLDKKGMLEKSFTISDEVKEIQIVKTKDTGITENMYSYEEEKIREKIFTAKQKATVKEKDSKKQLLDHASNNFEPYSLLVVYKDGTNRIAYLSEKNVPNLIKDELNK